jgi:hypothetical protein
VGCVVEGGKKLPFVGGAGSERWMALEGFPKITENLSKKVIRWILFASEFDFHTVFRPGVTNQNADTLSRIPKTEDVVLSGQTQVIKALTTQTFQIKQEKPEYCRKTRKKYEYYMRRNQSEGNDTN